jgi:hypothetical protein
MRSREMSTSRQRLHVLSREIHPPLPRLSGIGTHVFSTLRPRPLAELPQVLSELGEVRILASLMSNLFFLAAKACMFGMCALLTDLRSFSRQMETCTNVSGLEQTTMLVRQLQQWLLDSDGQQGDGEDAQQQTADTTLLSINSGSASPVRAGSPEAVTAGLSSPLDPSNRPTSPGRPASPGRLVSPGRPISPGQPASPGRSLNETRRTNNLVPLWISMLYQDKDSLCQPLQVKKGLHTYMCVHIHVCTLTCVYTCMCVHMHVCTRAQHKRTYFLKLHGDKEGKLCLPFQINKTPINTKYVHARTNKHVCCTNTHVFLC